jgi:hypothetical protein
MGYQYESSLPPAKEGPVKHDTALTVTALLSVLLLSLHLASDVVLGKDEFDRGMMVAILMLATGLYGALALRGRLAGYVVTLLFSLLAMVIPWVHMPAAGLTDEFVRRPGVWLFVWTLLALGATGFVAFALAVQGLWHLRRGRLHDRPTATARD